MGENRINAQTHQTKATPLSRFAKSLVVSCCFVVPFASALSPSAFRSLIQHQVQTKTVSCHIRIAADAPTGHLLTQLYSMYPKEDFEGRVDLDISTQIAKAKQLLNDAKKKKRGTGDRAMNAKSEEDKLPKYHFS